MAVLTSAILGALTSLVPEVVGIFRQREEMKYDLQLKRMDLDRLKYESQHEEGLADLRATIEEGKSLRSHDSTLSGGKWINGLRASVRPIITYLFFLLFVAIKAVGVYMIFLNNGGFVDLSIAWADVYPLIWGDDEKSIFAAVMGFWFGSRAINQMKRA